MNLANSLLLRDRRPRVRKSYPLYPDEGLKFKTRREAAIWKAANRPISGGSTAAGFYGSNLPFATGVATTHTNLNMLSPANHGLSIVEMGISFDGVTASAVPVLVEIGTGTQALTGTGAASPPAVQQVRGRSTGGGVPTEIHNCTVEPTVQVALRQWYVSPNGGTFVYPLPLGREIEIDSSGGTLKAFFIRTTSPATVNSRCYLEVEAI